MCVSSGGGEGVSFLPSSPGCASLPGLRADMLFLIAVFSVRFSPLEVIFSGFYDRCAVFSRDFNSLVVISFRHR